MLFITFRDQHDKKGGGEQVHGSHKFISRHTPRVISARRVYSMGSYTPASIPHAKNARSIEI